MKTGLLRGLVLSFSLIAGASASHAANSRKLIPISIGGPSAGYFLTYVAQDYHLYQKNGLDPTFYWFTSGAPLLSALKSGSIDETVTGLAFVFALGQHIPLKIISWELDNGQGEGLMVTKSSGITSYKDLDKARKIGAMPGTCSQVSLRIMAERAGINYNKLDVVNMPPPLFANAFTGGAIDAAVGWAPWTLEQPKNVKVVSWDRDYGGVCPSIDALRPEYIKEHPSVPQRLLAVQAEARAMIQRNPAIAIKALEQHLALSPRLAKAFYRIHCCAHLPTYKQQLEPDNQWSLVSKTGGLAGQALLASRVLHELGTIPAALTRQQIDAAIDPGPLRKYMSEHATQQ